MATYTLSINSGNQLISIPLDMSGVEDDPAVLFSPTLLNTAGNDYMYKHIFTAGQGLFNQGGEWRGNLDKIEPTKSYWLYSSNSHDKTFTGATITPQSLTYTLLYGINYVSFPFTQDYNFGVGDYSTIGTPDEGFILNKNLLKGSGHNDSSINYIQGQGQARQYGGLGSNSSDWSGNLNKFEHGKGYIVRVDSANFAPITANLWATSPTSRFLNITGVTTDDSDGNRAFYLPRLYSNSFMLIKFGQGAQIQKANEDVLLNFTGDKQTGASSSNAMLGFANYDKLYHDNGRPLYNIAGGFRSHSTFDVFDSTPTTYDKTKCGTLSSLATPPSDNQQLDENMAVYKTNPADCKFSAIANKTEVWFTLHSSNLFAEHGTSDNMPTPGSAGVTLSGFHKYSDGFYSPDSPLAQANGDGHRIAPIIYNPDYSDGQRFRFCKYYPHPSDWSSIIDGETINLNHPDIYDYFYDENGDRKYSTELGSPYAPAVQDILPYIYRLPAISYANIEMGVIGLSGIIREQT